MSTRIHKTASLLGKLAVAGAGLAGALLLAAPAGATSTPLIPPAIPGVAPLPGPVAAAAQPAANMGVLATKPDTGVAGTAMTISGANLPANKDVTITWATANVTWVVDARPDSVDYLGRKADKLTVVLATAKTDANGSFSVGLKAPKDFGGIHDIYAVVEGTQVAKGGFLIARSAKITPEAWPDRDDDHASRTRASARRCTKAVRPSLRQQVRRGDHGQLDPRDGDMSDSGRPARSASRINIGDAISFKYLNIQQSPIPWGTGS